jgi:hypothetical protein
MRSRTPTPYRPLGATPRPFPTRGVPGGWRDAWDDDPLAAVLVALPHRGPQRRSMIEANQQVELVAEAREDGRWQAHVTAWTRSNPASPSAFLSPGGSAATWPSVNGPTAAVALDALEAELREVVRGLLPETNSSSLS